jgi:hypothetical protein
VKYLENAGKKRTPQYPSNKNVFSQKNTKKISWKTNFQNKKCPAVISSQK